MGINLKSADGEGNRVRGKGAPRPLVGSGQKSGRGFA